MERGNIERGICKEHSRSEGSIRQVVGNEGGNEGGKWMSSVHIRAALSRPPNSIFPLNIMYLVFWP